MQTGIELHLNYLMMHYYLLVLLATTHVHFWSEMICFTSQNEMFKAVESTKLYELASKVAPSTLNIR